MADWNQVQPANWAIEALVKKYFPTVKKIDTAVVHRTVRGGDQMSAHSEGRAVDIYANAGVPAEKDVGDRVFGLCMEHAAELGLDHVIWNRQIWSSTQGLGPYPRPNDPKKKEKSLHTDHVHVAFTREGSQRTKFPEFERALKNLSFQNFVFFADVLLKQGSWSRRMTLRFSVYGFGIGQGTHAFVRNRWNCETPDLINLLAWDTYGLFFYNGTDFQCYDKHTSEKQPAFVLEDPPTWHSDRRHEVLPGAFRIERPRNEAGARGVVATWTMRPAVD